MRLTNSSVKTLPTPDGRQAYHYCDAMQNFGVRVSPGGTKSYFIQYKDPKTRRRKRKTIGRTTVISAEVARKQAKSLLAEVTLGNDPFAEESPTLQDAYGWYAEKVLIEKSRSYQNLVSNIWRNHTPKRMKGRLVDDLTRGEFLEISDKLIAEGKIASAKFAHSFYRAMLGVLFDYERIEKNVLLGVRPKAKPQSRDRVLSDDELAKVWAAAESYNIHYRMAIFTMMLTGCRVREVTDLEVGEVDVKRGVLNLRGERLKNRKDHTLKLPSRLSAMYQLYIPEHNQLFLAYRSGQRVHPNGIIKKLRKDTGIHDVRNHDLRRTIATNMARLGVFPHVIEFILNHARREISGVAEVYNRHRYEDEVARALQLHEDWLLKTVKPTLLLMSE